MSERVTKFKWVVFFASVVLFLYGCAGNRKALEEQVAYQNDTIEELKKQNAELQTRLSEKDAALQSVQQSSPNLENLRSSLQSQLHGTGANVGIRGDEIIISLPSVKLFAPGQYTLRPVAKNLLRKVSATIKTQVPGSTVRVEGHTDNQPIKKLKARFKSNWELSAARASSVLHYLVEQCHMDPKRVYMAGLGEYHPVANNSTSSGRQKNRRVELVIIPRESA